MTLDYHGVYCGVSCCPWICLYKCECVRPFPYLAQILSCITLWHCVLFFTILFIYEGSVDFVQGVRCYLALSQFFCRKMKSLTQTMYANFVSLFGLNKYSHELISNNNEPVTSFPIYMVRRDECLFANVAYDLI